MDRELLLEIGVEEMPASWLPPLTEQLAASLRTRLTEEGLQPRSAIETFSTPRRLTATVATLIDRQDDRDETVMGPPVSAAFDAEGHPTNAGLGFARKLGADFDALVQLDTPRGKYLAYERHIRGRATVDVLPDLLGRVLRDLAFPRQMRWDAQLEDGKGELLFGRPIRWLLFLYGGRVVPFTIARQSLASSLRVQDVTSGAVTYGHRFLATSGRAGRAIKVRSFDEYRKRLTESFVILSRIERRDRILRDLESHARRLNGRAMLHQHPQAQALLDEVPDLVEFPAVVAGSFSSEFLALPPEVLTSTLIHHQHYFPVVGQTGGLMPAFLAVTNTQAASDRAIATNAERVVAARLRDARFFWDADRQTPLESRLDRLDTLQFHKQLGSYRAKAERIERLARWLAADVFGLPADQADAATRAARLAKADLATDMVREFTELQGVMGGIYAREAGEPETVWKAIYYHYLPIALEATAPPAVDALGSARATWMCLSLADKLDTLVGLFLAGERPTGSRDPHGLRRQAHGVIRLLSDAELFLGKSVRPPLQDLTNRAFQGYGHKEQQQEAHLALWPFLWERQEFFFVARGHDRRNVRSIVSEGVGYFGPIRDVGARLAALKEFAKSDQFRQLATAFKRVRNISGELDKIATPKELEAWAKGDDPLGKLLKEPAENALLKEIDAREPKIEAAAARGDGFREAYAEAAGFEPAIARFFVEVFVMTDDEKLKKARLRLMRRLERLILKLGDISEIVTEP
jgi:glycyl-tRNA synthetase beta chain